MLIIGAGGFAVESLEILNQLNYTKEVYFFDNTKDIKRKMFDQFSIIKSEEELLSLFETSEKSFVLGVGTPEIRRKLFNLMISLGGEPQSLVSPFALIGKQGNTISQACNIMSNVVITCNVTIQKGVLINLNTTIGHDTTIDEFVDICPGVNISGGCIIGANTFVGTGSIILPKIRVGKNSIVAAGSVVTKDVPDHVMVAGNPAIIKKSI